MDTCTALHANLKECSRGPGILLQKKQLDQGNAFKPEQETASGGGP